MRVEEFDGHYSISIGEKTDVITVYKPRTMFGELKPAQVNWSACGSVDSDYAQEFAQGLLKASTLAMYENTKAGV